MCINSIIYFISYSEYVSLNAIYSYFILKSVDFMVFLDFGSLLSISSANYIGS